MAFFLLSKIKASVVSNRFTNRLLRKYDHEMVILESSSFLKLGQYLYFFFIFGCEKQEPEKQQKKEGSCTLSIGI